MSEDVRLELELEITSSFNGFRDIADEAQEPTTCFASSTSLLVLLREVPHGVNGVWAAGAMKTQTKI